MPRLRNVGNSLSNIGDQLMQHVLRLQAQEHQSSLVQQRQKELAEQTNTNRMGMAADLRKQQDREKGLSDPIIGRQLADAGNTDPGLNPSDDRLALPTVEAIGGAKSPNELITGDEIGLRLKGAGIKSPYGYDVLNIPGPTEAGVQKARNSRETLLTTEANKPNQFVEESLPDGSKRRVAVNPRTAGPMATGLSTSQQVTNANEMEAGTRKGKAQTAGAIAGAQAGAQNAAELAQLTDPRWLRAQTEKIRQEGIAKALAERSKDAAAMINEASTTVASITPDWEKMKILSKTVNTDKSGQFGTYYVTSPLQLNQDATELDSIGQNIAKRLANNNLFGGNKGAQSEKDSEAIANRLPNSYDSKEAANRKVIDFENNLYKGLKAMSELPVNASPQDKINTMRQSIGLDPIDLAAPPGPAGDVQIRDLSNRWDNFLNGGQSPIRPVPTHR